jgi:alpha-beta hydrolase superfamily lysophospholipase
MNSTVLAPFTARDGENLAMYEWPLDNWHTEMGHDAPPPRGVVLIVHGLGEHASRYTHVARLLLDWGFAVRAYDQRGHGESGGKRGVLTGDNVLLEDLAEVVDDTRLRCSRLPHAASAPPIPLVLLGHSLGGLVAARFVAKQIRPIEGLALSSPAFDVGLTPIQKLMLATMPALAPNLCMNNGLNPKYLSHNRDVVRDYLADPLVHKRISPRLARFIARAGPSTIAAAARWKTPSLLMYAGSDHIVNPAGSKAFAKTLMNSPAVKPGTLTARCFDGMYHELFNEVGSGEVFETLKAWLNARF